MLETVRTDFDGRPGWQRLAIVLIVLAVAALLCIGAISLLDRSGLSFGNIGDGAADRGSDTSTTVDNGDTGRTGNPFAGKSSCPYVGTGSSQPETEPIITLDGGDLYVLDLSELPGCAVVFEGRLPWQTHYRALATALANNDITAGDDAWRLWDVHFIIDVQSTMGVFDPRPYNELVAGEIPDEYMDDLVYEEGSVWFYDASWNMSDFATTKPSIAEELEAKKRRDAMDPGEYLFPRVIVQPSGQMSLFYGMDAGDAAYETFAGCTAGDEPESVPVHGLWNGSSFTAAIGAGGCRMAMWIDGASTPVIWDNYQKDGDEIVSYDSSVEVWIFPTSWSSSQVQNWATNHN